MIRRSWNALDVGDHVLVHDETAPSQPLLPGRVTAVESATGSNIVSVRVGSGRGSARVVQPRRLAVHLDSGESAERCWRCEAFYADERRAR